MQKICIYLHGRPFELETGENIEAVNKLNTVSEAINEMSRVYVDDINTSQEDGGKENFIELLSEKLYAIRNNVLYDDLSNEENGLMTDIFDILVEKNEITKKDILELLEKRSIYVVGFDDFDTNLKIEEDINIAVRLINDTYKIGKVNSLWNKRMKENKKVISSQLSGVSRAITDVAKSIYKGHEKYAFDEEKKEIKLLCLQKNIEVVEIEIEQGKNRKICCKSLSKSV